MVALLGWSEATFLEVIDLVVAIFFPDLDLRMIWAEIVADFFIFFCPNNI